MIVKYNSDCHLGLGDRKGPDAYCGWYPFAPYQLLGMGDMLQFNAQELLQVMKGLPLISKVFACVPDLIDDELIKGGLDPSTELFRNVREKVHANGCKQAWGKLQELFFAEMLRICILLDLDHAARKIERMRERFGDGAIDATALEESIKDLEDIIGDELKRRTFMFIPPERTRYFASKPPAFGELVLSKYPEMTADIVDACWCLGFERPTAAVFHLMCITELGIRRLAKRLGVPKDKVLHKTWKQIFDEINPEIQKLPYVSPKQRARRDRYSEALAHLRNVKDAWRNQTMHSRRRYNQEEAEAIFQNVKTFTQFLAGKVSG
jgi:hypothetical protein